MERNLTNIVSAIIIIGLVFLVAATSAFFLDSFRTSIDTVDTYSTQTILTESSDTLIPISLGITSSEVKANNDVWINCTTDDFVESERYDTISFWYKNSTVDWTFIVNSSGTLYVDGVLGTPEVFPVYDDGSNMFLCKTGVATFFNGSIDDFRGYASAIDAELVNLTYLGGRL